MNPSTPTAAVAVSAALLAVIVYGVVELLRHRRCLNSIPIRIHVNGTRGKSSVTRLIAAGLREAGLICCAKTTGTLPRMILPDGRELPIYRKARANVIEQIHITSLAAEFKPDALVIECMALQPELQWLSEHQLVRATHAVITNARPDHLDVMGPDEKAVALALSGMIPVGGVLLTAEQAPALKSIFQACCVDRGCRLVDISPDEVKGVEAETLRGFSYQEHADNIALAVRVCAEFGVDRETAVRGMQRAQPDPGALTEHQIDFFDRRLLFANGFAANDPISTEYIWSMINDRHAQMDSRIAVFNCRADRPDRSIQLGKAFVGWRKADHLILMGSGTYIFARAAVEAGWDANRLSLAEGLRTEEVFEIIIEHSARNSLVMGMGNIGGPGLDLVRFIKNRARLPETQGTPT